MIRLFLFVFRTTAKTLGKQIVVYPLRIDGLCLSGAVATWPVLQKKHSLRSDFSTNSFRWICLGFKDPHGGLLLCFGLIHKDPWFVTCDNLLNVFWGTAIVFFKHFFTPIDNNLFFERLSNCAGSNENKSFLRPAVHAVLNVCWWKKCQSFG